MTRDATTATCWACGRDADHFIEPDQPGTPAAGTFAICVDCGAEAVLTGNGWDMRPPTIAEAAQFQAIPAAAHTQRMIRRSQGV